MKIFLSILLLGVCSVSFAQKPCDYSTDVKDSIGTYKATKSYLVHERNFAGSASYIFFSLVNTDGMPFLSIQYIQKSSDFIKACCLDANSRIFLQLVNGKIVTLIHTNEESCGTMIKSPDDNKYSRILSSSFMFVKGSLEDLKASPVSLMRIKFTTETLDYVFRSEFTSELTKTTYQPENYFVDYLKCVE